jgi:hypothetical protein
LRIIVISDTRLDVDKDLSEGDSVGSEDVVSDGETCKERRSDSMIGTSAARRRRGG